MADLVVELYGVRVGSLRGRGAALDFVTEPAAIDAFGLDSLVLSVAVPLAVVPARARKDSRRTRRASHTRARAAGRRRCGRRAGERVRFSPGQQAPGR